MDLLEDLKMPLLNFRFAIIYIIHKMLVLLKNNLNYLKACVRYLLSNFYFSPKDSPSKTVKNVFCFN